MDLKCLRSESLEKVAEQMLRGIVNGHKMTPRALLYLELGVLPIRYIIKKIKISTLYSLTK